MQLLAASSYQEISFRCLVGREGIDAEGGQSVLADEAPQNDESRLAAMIIASRFTAQTFIRRSRSASAHANCKEDNVIRVAKIREPSVCCLLFMGG